MTYTVLPNSGQSLGITRVAINTNFSLIQSVFDLNHYTFNNTGAGKHRFVQFPSDLVPPATGATEWNIFNHALLGTQEIFVQPPAAATAYALTASKIPPVNAANGTSFLPGGLYMQWGVRNVAFVTPGLGGTLTFPQIFPTNCLIIVGTIFYTTTHPSGATSLTFDTAGMTGTSVKFDIESNSSQVKGFYWIAIGN